MTKDSPFGSTNRQPYLRCYQTNRLRPRSLSHVLARNAGCGPAQFPALRKHSTADRHPRLECEAIRIAHFRTQFVFITLISEAGTVSLVADFHSNGTHFRERNGEQPFFCGAMAVCYSDSGSGPVQVRQRSRGSSCRFLCRRQ